MPFIWQTVKSLQNLYLNPASKFIAVDGLNGSTTSAGDMVTGPCKTFDQAYNLTTDGKNDTIVVIGNGGSTGTARLDSALTFSNSAVNVRGICSPSKFSPRGRIAPTSTTTAFANFITLSGSGNFFENMQIWNGFGTDTTGQIALTINGHRNVFKNCHIAGNTAGADTTGRTLLIRGDENLFEDCVIGIDTNDSSVATKRIELAANPTSGLGAARNVFRNCVFPIRATATTPIMLYTAASSAMDRFVLFDNCMFINFGTATIAGLATLAASSGGYAIFKNCATAGAITGFGTAAGSRAQIYISGPTDGSTTAGIGYAPSA